jgi:hypothetical protein
VAGDRNIHDHADWQQVVSDHLQLPSQVELIHWHRVNDRLVGPISQLLVRLGGSQRCQRLLGGGSQDATDPMHVGCEPVWRKLRFAAGPAPVWRGSRTEK